VKNLVLFVPGLIAGVGLVVAGMTNPAKVIGFLDLAGEWDPSLAFVMVGAMLVFGVGSRLVMRRPAPIEGGSFPGKPSSQIDGRLIVGSALFGTGWGLVGFCPGPALTNVGALHVEALAFVAVMAVGMIVAQRVFGVDR
jgi:uncharacterized membrane protein YedE/YeeE